MREMRDTSRSSDTGRKIGDLLDRQGWVIALAAIVLALALITMVIVIVDFARDSKSTPCCSDSRTISSACDDGNQCTVDFVNGPFGCTHADQPSTVFCTSTAACFGDSTVCSSGQCVGTVCNGICSVVGDCPPIEFNGTGTFGAGACVGHACIYTIKQNTTFGYCGDAGTIYLQQCVGYLALNGTFTPCLTVDSQCINDYLERFSTLSCTYKFSCATIHANPVGIPASGKKKRSVYLES